MSVTTFSDTGLTDILDSELVETRMNAAITSPRMSPQSTIDQARGRVTV